MFPKGTNVVRKGKSENEPAFMIVGSSRFNASGSHNCIRKSSVGGLTQFLGKGFSTFFVYSSLVFVWLYDICRATVASINLNPTRLPIKSVDGRRSHGRKRGYH
ncbi:hypothetical protein PM082_019359 [Marasmius tenuissimus]|nr:hypothetical protein PM082_019359 [Marasmius tenuissimus]